MVKLLIPILVLLLTFTTGCVSDDEITPRLKIILEDNREIVLELYRDIAPQTVANFLDLVDQKYYDGVVFHRIIQNFMVQTGGYFMDGNTITPKSDTSKIKGEFSNNKHENNLAHTLGVISMARSGDFNGASNQFFICTATSPHLDGDYAAFGKTIDQKSNEVLLDLHKLNTVYVSGAFENFPNPPISIKSIRRIK